ncbi:FBP domain-containing protein [Naasia lichenicola]|uniref:FBP domain-containing protein n=1 Tax=Naasia lichenicola TaxID=2565933 RepID=A0A4S4FQC8_9MICO|nr:FBP domain-containing protein [Naasia lichenicola]THG31815.1 FBP domain-containing protein [Naasia lichenicola]
MHPLDPTTIRASFVNASRKELADLTVPPGLGELDWTKLDYLGWRDPKYARRAYMVVPTSASEGDALIGIVLKEADAKSGRRAQCSLCQDVTLPNDVVFYGARRAGSAGRTGNALGSLICSDFECSANVRKLPPMAYIGYDVEAARLNRMATLRERVSNFARAVLDD